MGVLDAPTPPLPRVARPSGFSAFTKLPNPTIYRMGNGRFGVQLNLTSLVPTTAATVIYVDRAGSGGNTGLTPASPWNFGTAIAAINAGAHWQYEVRWMPGEFQSTTWTDITKSCRMVAYQPGARITAFQSSGGSTWTAASGSAGVAGTIYATAKLSTSGVVDLVNLRTWTDRLSRTHRDYSVYQGMGTGANQAAALALITADGQYAFDGTNIYVRPIGAMDMTNSTTRANLRLRQQGTIGPTATGSGVVVYWKGIAFEGCPKFGATNNAIMVAEDCSFKYTSADGTTHDGGHAIHIRCTASSNGSDNFNYHDIAGNGTEFIEIECVGDTAGLYSTAETNNGSTCHEGCRGIRIGCSYSNSRGPSVADVNTAKTWNLGCDARTSVAPTVSNRSNWTIDSTAEIWLDECSSDGPNTGGGAGNGLTFKPNGSGTKIHISGYRGAVHPSPIEVPAQVGTVDYYRA